MAEAKDPCWGYSEEYPDGKLFEDGEVPKGFVDSPAKVKPKKKKKAAKK